MKEVYFARHGEAEANKAGVLAGAKLDSPLTDKGREHAHALSSVLDGKKIDLIVTSPLVRASETAAISAKDIGYKGEIVQNELFIERDFGSASNTPKPEAYAALDSGTATGVESVEDLADRAQRAIDWLLHVPEEHILVVSHAAFGKMIGTIAAGNEPKDYLQFGSISNGSVFTLKLEQ